MRRKKTGPVILILLNGKLGDPRPVLRLARSGARVVCANGGVRHAMALKLLPWIVIGDMDSLPAKLPRWKDTIYLCDFDENCSDFEKALRFAVQRGIRNVRVAGAVGGRLDQELVNLALLETYSASLDLGLADDSALILGPGSHCIPSRRGQRLTLIPATAQAHVTATGLRYPLTGEVLARASRGLSNIALDKNVRIRVHSGRLWVLH